MTAVPRDPKISELRELFKYLQEFRVVFRDSGTEEIKTPYGSSWSIWDLEYLYQQCDRLTLRQRQAITLCLVHGMREKDAAVAMGVSATNPVMMYATLGLRRLLDMVEDGELDRFRHERMSNQDKHERRRSSLYRLADEIKSRIRIARHDCWVYPTTIPNAVPRIRIRTVHTPSGFITINPLRVMYEAHVRPIPRGFGLLHPEIGAHFNACVNPSHPLLQMRHDVRRVS